MEYNIQIKQLREKMMLTQTELANLLGVSFASVNRWEKGHYKPTMKERRKLNEYFIKYKIVEE